MTPTVNLVPFAGLDLAYSRISIDDLDESFSDTYGILSLGGGLVLNQRFTIRPQVQIPLGLDEADPTFGLSFGIGFPRGGSGTPYLPPSARRFKELRADSPVRRPPAVPRLYFPLNPRTPGLAAPPVWFHRKFSTCGKTL